jgi:hypothetical protein
MVRPGSFNDGEGYLRAKRIIICLLGASWVFQMVLPTYVTADSALMRFLSPSGGISRELLPHEPEALVLNPALRAPRSLFPDLPVLMTRYGSGNPWFLPFLGVGFSRGETTDVMRQMLHESFTQATPSVQRLLENNVVPNEFQVGIRIPF